MLKLLIKFTSDEIIFDKCEKNTSEIDLNNTNVFNKNFTVFDEKYISKNLNLVSSFIKIIIAKKKISKAIIINNSITNLAIKIINSIDKINVLYINVDKMVSFETYELLKQSEHLKYLNCYNMPKYMFDELNKKKNFSIDLRSEICWFSNFMETNKLDTYSNIYYKRKIKITNTLNKEDLNDMNNFFIINSYLKQIDIYKFTKGNIDNIYKLITQNHISDITINIYQNNENLNSINKYINDLRNMQHSFKSKNIKFEIIYSKEYKQKNFLKQLNISFLKILAIIIILITSLSYVAAKYINDKDSEQIEKITEELNITTEEEVIPEVIEEQPVEPEAEQPEPTENTQNGLTQNFDQLLAINNETVGWIRMNNTNINYPVVQHTDNDYYLNKDFYHNNNINGWIYMDYRNSINNLSDNTIIYGHTNYTNYSLMFGTLINTLDASWYNNDANTYITFNTLNGNYKFKIFSIYVIDVTSDYLVSDFKSEINHQNFINIITGRSIHNFNTNVTTADRILTLSTCYNKGNQRLVVHAKLVN